MDVFFWAIAPRVVFWTRFEANFRLGGNRRPLFLNGLTSPRVPGQLPYFLRYFNLSYCISTGLRRSISMITASPIDPVLFALDDLRRRVGEDARIPENVLKALLSDIDGKADGLPELTRVLQGGGNGSAY